MTDVVSVSGNVVADPVVTRAGGVALVKLRLAVKDWIRGSDGNWVSGETEFIDVACWRDLALNVSTSVRKGMRVVVRGERQVRQFVRRDGTEGEQAEIVAADVGVSLVFGSATFVPSGRRGGEPVKADVSVYRPPAVSESERDPWDF